MLSGLFVAEVARVSGNLLVIPAGKSLSGRWRSRVAFVNGSLFVLPDSVEAADEDVLLSGLL